MRNQITERLSGKTQISGVYFGKDGYLIDAFTSYSPTQFTANINALVQLSETLKAAGIPMQGMLVPTAAQILSDKLPAYAPNLDQRALMDFAKAQGLDTVNVFDILSGHKDEDIYAGRPALADPARHRAAGQVLASAAHAGESGRFRLRADGERNAADRRAGYRPNLLSAPQYRRCRDGLPEAGDFRLRSVGNGAKVKNAIRPESDGSLANDIILYHDSVILPLLPRLPRKEPLSLTFSKIRI